MKKYYPWIVCLLCVLLAFCACGLVTVAFSTYFPYLRESIGLTSTQTSMITTVRCLSTMVSMLFAGIYYKKFSLRAGTLIAVMAVPAAYLIFAHSRTVAACYIGAAVAGIPYALGNVIPITQIIRNWFKSREATALAIAMSGTGVSTAVMPPVITKLIDHYGLTSAFYAVGIFAVISAVIIFLIVRDRPEELGLEPYRGSEKAKAKKQAVVLAGRDLSGTEMILFVLIMLIMGYVGTPYTHHLSLHYTQIGYTGIQAAMGISIYGAFLILSKILFGAGVDRFGAYKMNYIFFMLWILGSGFTMILNGESAGALYGSSVLNGLGIALGTIGLTVWTRDLSSDEAYAKRVKQSQTLFQVGSLIGSPVPGIIADRTGGYREAYLTFTLALIVMFIIIQIMYARRMMGKVRCGNEFSFLCPNQIVLTHDLARTLREARESLGVSHAFVVTDPGIAKLDNYRNFKKCMADAGFAYTEFTEAEPNPTDVSVIHCEEHLRQSGCDCVIGFGGGSSMDTAKASNVLFCNGGDISDYYGVDLVKKELLPFIAIPTTAGSGAEITRLLSMTDTKRQVKAQISSQKIASKIAVLYPNNLLGTPKSLTMAVGYDAMTHAIEAYLNRKGNAITQALALKAYELMAKNLVRFAENNQEPECAEALQIGAMLAGMAASTIGNGDAHNIARAVGGRFHHIHHGAALAVVLPHVLNFNLDVRTREMAELAHAMGLDTNGMTQREAAQAFVLAVQQIRDDLGMTGSYQEFGADLDCMEELIAGAAFNSENGSSAFAAPRKASHDDYAALITDAYYGKKVKYE